MRKRWGRLVDTTVAEWPPCGFYKVFGRGMDAASSVSSSAAAATSSSKCFKLSVDCVDGVPVHIFIPCCRDHVHNCLRVQGEGISFAGAL
eukprot:scaffold6420_cov168-Amphora_coffeaeformis.AAC.40